MLLCATCVHFPLTPTAPPRQSAAVALPARSSHFTLHLRPSLRTLHTSYGLGGSPCCFARRSPRPFSLGLRRSPGRRGRFRLRPESDVRAAVPARRDLHPQQHMLLLPGLRRRELPVWWCYKPFLSTFAFHCISVNHEKCIIIDGNSSTEQSLPETCGQHSKELWPALTTSFLLINF